MNFLVWHKKIIWRHNSFVWRNTTPNTEQGLFMFLFLFVFIWVSTSVTKSQRDYFLSWEKMKNTLDIAYSVTRLRVNNAIFSSWSPDGLKKKYNHSLEKEEGKKDPRSEKAKVNSSLWNYSNNIWQTLLWVI